MIGPRALIGLSLLSALLFCAVAAPSAFATKGTTAFTCVKDDSQREFEDAHCTKAAPPPGAGYKHVEIKPGTETTVTTTNQNTAENTTKHTPAVLHAIIAGLKVTITCTKVHGTGTLTNNAGPPMNVSGTGTSVFSECDAILSLKLCEEVNKGKPIESKELISTPTEAMEVKIEEDKEAFAKFNIKCAGKEFEVVVKGSATGIPNGATTEYTEASTKGNVGCTSGLCVGGQPAWIELTTTTTMSTTEPGIALTTTEP